MVERGQIIRRRDAGEARAVTSDRNATRKIARTNILNVCRRAVPPFRPSKDPSSMAEEIGKDVVLICNCNSSQYRPLLHITGFGSSVGVGG